MEIAAAMGISVKTVGVYQDHIKKKLGIDNIFELASMPSNGSRVPEERA